MKVGSGFCPFSCVRRLAECDASLLLKEEASSPPEGGFFKKFLSLKRLVKKSVEYSLDFGQSPAVGLLPYLFEKRPQTADNATTPGPQVENHRRGRNKNATIFLPAIISPFISLRQKRELRLRKTYCSKYPILLWIYEKMRNLVTMRLHISIHSNNVSFGFSFVMG